MQFLFKKFNKLQSHTQFSYALTSLQILLCSEKPRIAAKLRDINIKLLRKISQHNLQENSNLKITTLESLWGLSLTFADVMDNKTDYNSKESHTNKNNGILRYLKH